MLGKNRGQKHSDGCSKPARGPSATLSDGGQKQGPAKEIKNRTSDFDTSLNTNQQSVALL